MCFVLCLHRYLQGYVWVCVFPVGRFTGTVRPGECWPRGQETATPEEDNDTLLSWSALSGGNYLGEWLSSLWRWIVVWETDCGNGRMSKHKETERQSGETDHHHWGRNCTGFRDTYSLGARPDTAHVFCFLQRVWHLGPAFATLTLTCYYGLPNLRRKEERITAYKTYLHTLPHNRKTDYFLQYYCCCVFTTSAVVVNTCSLECVKMQHIFH